ncbi:GNAT family N-acetyltransferase [Pontibacter sp. G13]|uniref:GNAT family N-acetyltransferase n=1 Tax=Pontibacter sp. G13 TaxID=3074898 RepID=UPI00288B9AFB|nr:GNAT family N-acetyltransferase [Pontibacter sp. G13]WNJ18347.1 GNAT family N-acetyltransferase [Pontibacter sp. G13]
MTHFLSIDWASDRPDLAIAFTQGHLKALRDFGVKGLHGASDPASSFCRLAMITLHDQQGRILGGIKLRVLGHDSTHSQYLTLAGKVSLADGHPAPIEIGELEGLWVHRNMRGQNLSKLICQAALAFAGSLLLDRIILVSSGHMRPLLEELGFRINIHQGHSGTIPYPSSHYISYFMDHETPIELAHLSAENRKIILTLRQCLKVSQRVEWKSMDGQYKPSGITLRPF